MLNRMLALCLTMILSFSAVGTASVVYGAGDTADAYFSVETGSESSLNIQVTATSTVAPVMTKNGNKYTWKVNNDVSSKLLFDIDDSLGNSAIDGSAYTVEIEYYDYSATITDFSFFSIWVDKLNYGMQRVQDIALKGDGAWKKVTIEVEDAAFGYNTASEADIMIRLYDKTGVMYDVASAQPLYFKAINITRIPEKNPVLVESYIENAANTFEYTETKQVQNTFTNTKAEDVALKAEYFMVDGVGDVKFSFTEKFTVPAASSIERVVTIDSSECGVFQWVVKVSDDKGSINSRFLEDTIVIVKTAEDGLKNEAAWIQCHLERYRDNSSMVAWKNLTEEQKTALELINMANIKGARHETSWHLVEYNTEDATRKLNFEGTYYYNVANHYEDYGVDYWVRLGGCAYGYKEGESYSDYIANRMPTTPEEVDAWEKFCKYIIEIYANRGVELFEIWNEPNVASFNPGNATPAQLAEITKRAKKAANELYSEGKIPKPVKIAGLSVTEVNEEKTFENWLKPAVEAGIVGGSYGMDVLNIHPYDHYTMTEERKSYEWVQKYRDYIKSETGVNAIPVLVSEYGNVVGERQTEAQKRDWNIRTALLFRMYGMGDQFAIYNLGQKGDIIGQDDDHYGIVSPLIDELNVEGKIGIPTESYVAYAGMNYVLRGEVEPVEIIDCGDKVNINHLKRTTLGDEVLALWTATGDAEITLDLGVNSVTYYDTFGNENFITSNDGTYTIPLTESVGYITGNFKKAELVNAKHVFYDGFSDYTGNPWGPPAGWLLKSLSDSERDDGTNLSAVDGKNGKGVSLGSSGSNGKFRHPALYKNVGYAVAENSPVRFHTDIKIDDNRGFMDTIRGTSVNNNKYHVGISKASDTEDFIMGFKLVGESDKLGVYYWDETANNFVKSNKSFDVDKFVSLDAVYYPEAKPEINGAPYGQTFDSENVIDGTSDWTKTSTKWGSNALATLPVTYVESEGNRTGVLKATTTNSQWMQVRSPADFNLPIDETTKYVDVMFDYKSQPTDNGTDVYTIVALRTDKLDRFTGIQIDEATMYSLDGETKYHSGSQTKMDNVLGVWKSYKLRYYPNDGRMEVYMGDTQATISDTPILSQDLLVSRDGTEKLLWNSQKHGSKITGIGFQMNQLNSNMYIDNVRGASYSYYGSEAEAADRVEYYVNGEKAGEGKSGIGSNNSLETVMLASLTKASNSCFPAIFDNVCIVPETQNSIFFEEKRHSEADGTLELKTTAVNMFGLDTDVTIVTAFYDEQNHLLDAKITSAPLSGSFVEMSGGKKQMPDEVLQTRFFIWDTESLKPLSPMYKMRNN